MSERHTGGGAVATTGAVVALRRWWWLVVLGVLLGLVAATTLTRAQEVRYTATTSLLVLATDVDASVSSSRPEVNMDTEAELVRSAQVAEVTRGLLRTTATADALRAGLEVTVPLNSQVLSITYTDLSAASAQAGAQAFAEGYLSFRAGEAQRDLVARSSALQADLDAAQQELRAATDKAAALPANSPDRVFAEAQRGILSSRISTLSARLSALEAGSPTPGQVITAAALPPGPSSPKTHLNLAGGVLVGLLLGTALAGIADRYGRRLRDRDDVVRKTGQPVLLELRSSATSFDALRNGPAGPFDRLRNTLSTQGELPELLQVSDPAGHGASAPVVVGMAQSIVRATSSVTLVLAHQPSAVTRWLGLEDRDGLSEVLAGTAALEQVLLDVPDLPGVRILPPGRAADRLGVLLQSREARAVLRRLRSTGSVTLIETAGAGRSAGAQAVAAESDAVLLVVERGSTRHQLVTASIGATQDMGTDVAGVVLTPRVRTRAVRTMRAAPRDSFALADTSASTSARGNGRRRSDKLATTSGPVTEITSRAADQRSPTP